MDESTEVMNVFDRVDKLREENDARYPTSLFEAGEQDNLDKIYKDLYRLRYGGAMDEGQDLRTNLICVTNSLLDLMSYLGKRDENQ